MGEEEEEVETAVHEDKFLLVILEGLRIVRRYIRVLYIARVHICINKGFRRDQI